jgi:hypothetical protein
VCERCSALEGKLYSIEEAEGLILVHPNCRCTFIPAVKDLRGGSCDEQSKWTRRVIRVHCIQRARWRASQGTHSGEEC